MQATLDDPDMRRPRSAGLSAGMVVGRYVLLEWLGAGAMGSVFAARDPLLDRRVALKVLHPNRRTPRASQRLLREARALARLSDPHVVTINDVGIDGDLLYMAMELVEGRTLAEWIADGDHDWRNVLRVMTQAALGLAAVHEAGIVHRDFKPDNVMIDAAGRVQIADFGIALAEADPSSDELTRSASMQAHRDAVLASGSEDGSAGAVAHTLGALGTDGPGAVRLTRTGALLGTPRYMAPEQFVRGTIDARTDQYAFCLVLWEAVFGAHPREGVSLPQLALDVAAGVLPRVPAGPVPAWLGRALLQGLAHDPGQRHGSMMALVEILGRGGRQRRRWAMAGVGVLALGVGVAAVAVDERTQTPCDGEARMAEVWSEAHALRVREAFEATTLPLATIAHARIVRHLDGYRDAWVEQYAQACRVRSSVDAPDQSELDARIACLNERRAGLDQLAQVLSQADETVVENADTAVLSLRPVDDCKGHARAAALEPPSDLRVQVGQLEHGLAQAHALHTAGLYRRSLSAIEGVHEQLAAVPHPPLHAAVWLALGLEQYQLHADDEAIASLERAVAVASEAGMDELVVRASLALSEIYVERRAAVEPASRWVRHAEAALARLDDAPRLRSNWLDAKGNLELLRANYEATQSLWLEVLELRREAVGRNTLAVADTYHQLSRLEGERGDYDASIAYLEQAVTIRRRLLGPIHPSVTGLVAGIQDKYRSKGDYARAHEYDTELIPLLEAAYGPNHPALVPTLVRRSALLGSEGYYDDALSYLSRALAIVRGTDGPEHPNVSVIISNRGVVQGAMGRHEEAIASQREALRIVEATFVADHPRMAIVLDNLGNALVEGGSPHEALPLHRRALPIWERAAPESASVAISLTDQSLALLATGQAAVATPLLERAQRIFASRSLDPIELARARFALARALFDGGGDRVRAHSLATQALRAYADDPLRGPRIVPTIEAWLAQAEAAPQ